jgi:L-ascorbate metabolism protein UlaG (beta-lactamase superfamily)
MKTTYYGHACFAVEINRRTLLFDPFITANELARSVDVNKIAPDYLLISHGHQDHLADAAGIARRTGATIISNYEVIAWFNRQGLQKTHSLNHGGGGSFDFGRVKFVNAIHSSGLPDGTYGGNPGGFVIESPEGNFYYSGDTALTMDMKLIGESTRLTFAVLPIGDNFTMGVADAVKAAEFVRCDEILGVHYDTFRRSKSIRRQPLQPSSRRTSACTCSGPAKRTTFEPGRCSDRCDVLQREGMLLPSHNPIVRCAGYSLLARCGDVPCLLCGPAEAGLFGASSNCHPGQTVSPQRDWTTNGFRP